MSQQLSYYLEDFLDNKNANIGSENPNKNKPLARKIFHEFALSRKTDILAISYAEKENPDTSVISTFEMGFWDLKVIKEKKDMNDKVNLNFQFKNK